MRKVNDHTYEHTFHADWFQVIAAASKALTELKYKISRDFSPLSPIIRFGLTEDASENHLVTITDDRSDDRKPNCKVLFFLADSKDETWISLVASIQRVLDSDTKA